MARCGPGTNRASIKLSLATGSLRCTAAFQLINPAIREPARTSTVHGFSIRDDLPWRPVRLNAATRITRLASIGPLANGLWVLGSLPSLV